MGGRCYGRHGRCYVLNIRWNLDQLTPPIPTPEVVTRAFDGRKELMKDVVRVVTHVKKLFISISTELIKAIVIGW